jgi:predicted nucleotidyltransferase component of viral defense system
LIERRYVDFYANASGVDRLIAEKDIILTYVLKVLSTGLLSNVAFKGGTSLKKIWLGKTARFSEDLDFTSIGMKSQDFRKRFRDCLHQKTYYGIRFEVVDEYPKGIHSLMETDSYGAVVAYSHEWNESQLLTQVSFRETPILKVVSRNIIEEIYFKYCEFPPFDIPCVQREEVLSEKIRAAYQRMGSRDLYDLFLFAKRPYTRTLVKTLVVIKFWNIREFFDPTLFFDRIEKEEHSFSELHNLVSGRRSPNRNQIIGTLRKEYTYLKDLPGNLKEIIEDSKSHRKRGLVKRVMDQISSN